MLLPENIRIGKVYRIIWDGYVYLDEIFPENSYRRHVACFTKIPGYRGESAKELGIKIGTRALYRVDHNERVQEIIFDAQPRKLRKFWIFTF